MNDSTIRFILEKNNLSITKQRIELLDFLLSHKKKKIPRFLLEKHFKGKIDRVTIYRNLKVFSEKGIIKEIRAANKIFYTFALKESDTYHMHFYCKLCKTVYCIENTYIDKKNLPKNFRIDEIEITANGVCEKCII